MIKFGKNHPYLFQVLLSLVLGIAGSFVYILPDHGIDFLMEPGIAYLSNLYSLLVLGSFAGMFLAYPPVITAYEFGSLFGAIRCGQKEQDSPSAEGRGVRLGYHLYVILLAIGYEFIYLGLIKNINFGADWTEQLYNAAVHTPVFTGAYGTIWVLVLLSLLGLSVMIFYPVRKLPPLAAALSLSAMYLGVVLSIVWTVQIFIYENIMDLLLLLLPVNALTITAQVMIVKIREYEPDPERRGKIDSVPFLGWCNRTLENAKLWPVAAFLLMWPLLGILIAVLVLFGQAPDSVIKAWTETSDFRLSQRVAPQNLYYDEHYLCTVAAGGHRKVVKPQRRGIRHGHEVIVNRQLCVANAFEQILEERTPKAHRAIRSFYDTYGFPIAKRIRSQYAADLVYFLMKPLEWCFLAVLYLTDVHPEDRIVLQYTGKTLREAEKNLLIASE